MVSTINAGTGQQWLEQGCTGGLSVWLASQWLEQGLSVWLAAMQEQLPRGLRVARVADGAVELRSGDEYEVKLILVPAPEQMSDAAQSGLQHRFELPSDN